MKRLAQPQMNSRQAMVQLKMFLASMPDDKLAALTVERVCATHRVPKREAEVVLLAAQETRRRWIARSAG